MAWTRTGLVALALMTLVVSVTSQPNQATLQKFRQFVQMWQRFQQNSHPTSVPRNPVPTPWNARAPGPSPYNPPLSRHNPAPPPYNQNPPPYNYNLPPYNRNPPPYNPVQSPAQPSPYPHSPIRSPAQPQPQFRAPNAASAGGGGTPFPIPRWPQNHKQQPPPQPQPQPQPAGARRPPWAWKPPTTTAAPATSKPTSVWDKLAGLGSNAADPSSPILGPCQSNKQCPSTHCCVPAMGPGAGAGTTSAPWVPKICLNRRLAAGRCTEMPPGSCKNSYDCPAAHCCRLNVTSARPSMATGGKPFNVYGSCTKWGDVNAQCMVMPSPNLPEGLHFLCPCTETLECIPDGGTAGNFGRTGRCLNPEMRRCRSAQECGRGHCCRPLTTTGGGGGFGVCEPLGRHGAACDMNRAWGAAMSHCPCESEFMCMPDNNNRGFGNRNGFSPMSRQGVCKPIVPRTCSSDAQCGHLECCANYRPSGGTAMWMMVSPQATCQPRGGEGQECLAQPEATTGTAQGTGAPPLPSSCGCSGEMFCIPQGPSRPGVGVMGRCSLTEPVSCNAEADCGANECCTSGTCQPKSSRGQPCTAMNPLMAMVFGSSSCGCKAGLTCRPSGPSASSGICS